jgi:hypothetical protein
MTSSSLRGRPWPRPQRAELGQRGDDVEVNLGGDEWKVELGGRCSSAVRWRLPSPLRHCICLILACFSGDRIPCGC